MQNAAASARLMLERQNSPGEQVMAGTNHSVPTSHEDRETRIKQLMKPLQPLLEQRARKMAEARTDTPPEQILGESTRARGTLNAGLR